MQVRAFERYIPLIIPFVIKIFVMSFFNGRYPQILLHYPIINVSFDINDGPPSIDSILVYIFTLHT